MPLKTGYPCCPCGSHLVCRYAFYHYKAQLVCFSCRKAFKRRLKSDVDPDGPDHPARCPECGGEVFDLGLGFRPPPRTQVKRWAALESLHARGIKFHCCRSCSFKRHASPSQLA